MRRPPSGGGFRAEIQMGNSSTGGTSSSSSKRRCCNLQRLIVCTFVAVVITFLVMQIRGIFGIMLSNSDASHLRGISPGKSEEVVDKMV